MVIIATQGHGDEEAVEQAVTGKPAFVGLVASRKRGEAVLGYLADRGVSKDLLDEVRVPVGFDLGHTSHPEIAVAVLAELVELRAKGALNNGPRIPRSPFRSQSNDPGTAIDLVCGMAVPADDAGRPFEFEGVTYYFCCPVAGRLREDPPRFIDQEELHADQAPTSRSPSPSTGLGVLPGHPARLPPACPAHLRPTRWAKTSTPGNVAIRPGSGAGPVRRCADALTKRRRGQQDHRHRRLGADAKGRGQAALGLPPLAPQRQPAPRFRSSKTFNSRRRGPIRAGHGAELGTGYPHDQFRRT